MKRRLDSGWLSFYFFSILVCCLITFVNGYENLALLGLIGTMYIEVAFGFNGKTKND